MGDPQPWEHVVLLPGVGVPAVEVPYCQCLSFRRALLIGLGKLSLFVAILVNLISHDCVYKQRLCCCLLGCLIFSIMNSLGTI